MRISNVALLVHRENLYNAETFEAFKKAQISFVDFLIDCDQFTEEMEAEILTTQKKYLQLFLGDTDPEVTSEAFAVV